MVLHKCGIVYVFIGYVWVVSGGYLTEGKVEKEEVFMMTEGIS